MKMKAYIGWIKDEEWIMLIHGETAGKAKARFCRCNPAGYASFEIFTDIRLTRIPAWDDRPFLDEPDTRALFAAVDYEENGDPIYDSVINDCNCPLCKGTGKQRLDLS